MSKMGSFNPENDSKQELNDSGCVQDASVTESYKGQAQLLDLSDDVLLFILRLCSPMDLKALGYTCPRLGTLICDRTLWQRVDARDTPTGVERLQWLLTHCLSPSTQELKLSGYVNRETRCLGIQDLTTWPWLSEGGSSSSPADFEHFLLSMWYPHSPRHGMSPRWPDKRETAGKEYLLPGIMRASEDKSNFPSNPISQLASQIVPGGLNTIICNTNGPNSRNTDRNACDAATNTTQEGTKSDHVDPKEAQKKEMERIAAKCTGPQFTVNETLWKILRTKCENLISLSLDYCNLDYKITNPRCFPPKLKKLSLRGTRCYNLPLRMSFLGKIHYELPELEYLDISECEWLEPASLIPLSKLAHLRELYMRKCVRLTECVAYASVATRYGFQKLKILDLRGSPVTDSEVSALGWLPLLEELYVSPPHDVRNTEHWHKWDDELAPFCELDSWEAEVPDYYKCKTPPPEQIEEEEEELKEEERLGDAMVGNYNTRASLQRRIIVIQPNRQNNENRQNNNNFIPEVLRAHGYRPPAENNDPAPGPSKRPHSDNVQDSVKRPRLDKETNTTEDSEEENKTKKEKTQETSTPGPSNLKTANAKPSDETPGTSKSDSASRRHTKPENQPNLLRRSPRIKNSTITVDNLIANDQRINRSGQARPSVPLQNRAEERPDGAQHRRIYPGERRVLRGEGHVMHADLDVQQNDHLVTDSAVLRFGRAENDNVNYVDIGPGFNANSTGNRPDQSNLRILSITGYSQITDRSLEHLATAAPHLRYIDFRFTSITSAGVEYFKAFRPNCEVVYGRFGAVFVCEYI